jgi:hypothetical protein
MNDPFITKDISGEQVMRDAMKINGGGVNTKIPLTHRLNQTLPKKQIIKDSEIVKEITYLFDVLNEKDKAVDVFIENRYRLSDQCYWEMLRTMWIANGKGKYLLMFRQMFQTKRPFKKFLMTVEEEAVFNALPDPVTALRAVAVEDEGISWTLSKEFAEQYAKHLRRTIVEKQFPKSRIVAYFNRRNEQEIIVL